MESLVRRSIEIVRATARVNVPWVLDKPYTQPYYSWSASADTNNGVWQAHNPSSREDARPAAVQSIMLYSWNIDFMLPFPDSRMRIALRHLEDQASKRNASTATIPGYGELSTSLTLMGLIGSQVIMTRMERDALFVDLKMGEQGKLIRLCNTHLESLALDPPFRPLQMQLCAKYMHESTVDGAILAGDLNAIQDFDRRLHSDNDLKDAYLELGGIEDDAEASNTWGQQAATAQRQQFGTSRMDKIFFCGDVMCTAFERFGAGIELRDEGEREEILSLGFDRPMAGNGPAFFDQLPRSPAQPERPPLLEKGTVPVSPGPDQLPRSPGQQERPPLLGQGTAPLYPASGITWRHRYLPFGAPPIPGRSPLVSPPPNNPLTSPTPQTQSKAGQACPPIGLLGGPAPFGAPSPPPRNRWDCDPPLPANSPLRGKFDWGPPLPKNSPLRQLWGQSLSTQTPPRAHSARAGTGSAPLSSINQPTSSQPMRPVMLPCVTGSLPSSQTAAASKAPARQGLANSDPSGNGALVRGPTLYDLEPTYRHGPAIPTGKGMELNGQRLEPTQGTQGYGIYAPSSDGNVIDFYPVNGNGLSSQEAPFQAPQRNLQPLEPPAQEPAQPEFIPFNWEPPNSGPDLVDPKFREVMAQIMTIFPPNVDTEVKKARLFEETIGPMAIKRKINYLFP
ncbi:hypothetical protein KC349_g7812 [Hortaea werneckii]|nr:hypothetical protein KC349_g7812 [Hortaea werneckii]